MVYSSFPVRIVITASYFSDFKQQILANLANFAYDPVNYEFFRQLNILDLFLGM